MIYFIEMWTPTAAWLALSSVERVDYVQKVAAATKALIDQGVEILTWSVSEQDISQPGPHEYFAIWKFPTQELSESFQTTVEQAGWYNYFDQVNLQGKQDTAQNVLSHLTELKTAQYSH